MIYVFCSFKSVFCYLCSTKPNTLHTCVTA